MDIFQKRRQQRLIMGWQRFLTDRKLLSGKQNGADSDTFREAVSAFQHHCGLPQNGDITDTDTLAAAREHGLDRDFEIGPDHGGDLRENRPYFVVPLDKGQSAMQDVYNRIAAWIEKAAGQPGALLLHVSATAGGRTQQPGEVQDPTGLLRRLRDARRHSAAGALREQLSCDTERRLKSLALKEFADWDLIRTVVNEINSLLAGPCLTEMAGHLNGLPADLAAGLKDDQTGAQERLLVNRRLLRLAFPDHIRELQPRGPVTDIFVFSHGWHRNFFAAVAAYDQLVSRFTLLLRRERLVPPAPFHPLFLAFHWHSDPGQDGWVDKSGRRRKRAFLELVEETFQRPAEPVERGQPKEKRFTTVFEDIFQLLARMSAPGTDCLTDQELRSQAHDLAGRLEPFSLREAPDADISIKIVAVWSCYHQSVPIRILHDQDDPPKRFNSVWDSVKTLANFVVGVVGIGVVLGWVFHLSWGNVRGELISVCTRLVELPFWTTLARWLVDLPLFGPRFPAIGHRAEGIWLGIGTVWGRQWRIGEVHLPLGMAAVVLFASLIVLCTAAVNSWLKGPDHEPKNMPLLPVAAWLPVQVVFAAPLLLTAFLYFFVGGPILSLLGWMGFHPTLGLYDERDGKRNSVPPPHLYPETSRFRQRVSRAAIWLSSPRRIFAWIARLPLSWVRKCVAPDSVVANLAEAIDNQFDFWEMQRLGVEAGREAAAFLEKMLTPQRRPDTPENIAIAGIKEDVRLHFIGHSFGGLVITNAARRLALNKDQAVRAKDVGTYRRVNPHSLILLQAAVASSWFEKEEILRRSVKGAVANIYSRYDTANGFYYPLANSGRQAAGSVGLFGVGRDEIKGSPRAVETVGKGGRLASLVEPPDLASWAATPADDAPYLLNLDASRLISEGNVALGGGHGDIFKDDIVNLAWAVMRLKMSAPAETPSPAAIVPPDAPPPSEYPSVDARQEPAGLRQNGTARAAGRNSEGIMLAFVAVAHVGLAAVLLARRSPENPPQAPQDKRLLE